MVEMNEASVSPQPEVISSGAVTAPSTSPNITQNEFASTLVPSTLIPMAGITSTTVILPPSQPHVVSSSPALTETTINIPQGAHRHDGAYGEFMVVIPPPPRPQHNGELTEFQRARIRDIEQQHLILFGLQHVRQYPKPYDDCPELPSVDDIGPPKVDFNAPPAYESVAKPPTYEDVQREKHFEEHYLAGNGRPGNAPPTVPNRSNRPMAFLATIDAENGRETESDALLGTDFMFITAFIVAFLFNWIGFLLLICFCHTVAARYGALSGFGVSLAKWTFIVRTSTEVTSHENDWLWWLIMAFGCLICIRAFLQYITIKRSWNTLSEQAQERFFFIY